MVTRAIKVALIVGTTLALINHSEKIISLSLSVKDWCKIFLTYLVPYGVSTWSAVGAIRERNSDAPQP
ncbi:nitrate/nitrite transporter NrtS [Arenicella xantha]|uniref:nitrate/nitrite transporter NrtS n=1 Tax=Arenicella xantha TaxID=644221 RepID=UPI003CCC560B